MDITPPPEQGNVVSRWPNAKKAGKAAATIASAGVSAAEHYLNLSLLTVGAAASATGIGLVVTGAVFTAATIGASAVSAYKTYSHRQALETIYERRNCFGCQAWGPGPPMYGQHAYLAETVLPYVIEQKGRKLKRKVAGAVGLGVLASAQSAASGAYKYFAKTKGKARNAAAQWLAQHFLTHNCGLAQAMVAELYSFEEMIWMLEQDSDTITPLLVRKMAST